MLLDDVMPAWHFRERHVTAIAAPRSRVFAVLRTLTPREAPLFRTLMAVRALPGRLSGRAGLLVSLDSPLLDQFVAAGFAVLAEESDRELVVGAIGRFWNFRGASLLPVGDRAAFAAFGAPGFAKAALNFHLEDADGRTRLGTETRVFATDDPSRRRFGRYWLLIRLGSGAIRREWLAAAKRLAERG